MEREVIGGSGVVAFYDPRKWNRKAHKPGGLGFIHRDDTKCPVEPKDCRNKTHRIHFTVFQVQWIGAWNLTYGTKVKFKANPARREGDSPTAFRLELVEQKRRERPEKSIPADVRYGR